MRTGQPKHLPKEPPKQELLLSPLRYPGGKGRIASSLGRLIDSNGFSGGIYYEPFAGGGGVGLRLLSKGTVSEVVLNDADRHLYCFWISVLKHTEQFVDKLLHSRITIAEWKKQKDVYDHPSRFSSFQVGFSTFFLNRCNRSGILSGAGPIGGYRQEGVWKISERFTKSVLAERILRIGKLADRITVKNLDAIEFLKRNLPSGSARSKAFVYADPPYTSAGPRLYLNLYQEKEHRRLAKYLLASNSFGWVVTYDDCPLVRQIYSDCHRYPFELSYSLQTQRTGTELLIVPITLSVPRRLMAA